MTLLLPAVCPPRPAPIRRFVGMRRVIPSGPTIAVEPSIGSVLDYVWCCDALTLLRSLPDNHVNCIVTSPPYFGLRDYGVDGQIGLEPTPQAFVAALRDLFREARRVLRDDGTLWVNLGDTYANDEKWGGATSGKHVAALHGNTSVGRERKFTGLPSKQMLGIPWRVAFALQDDGWILRSDIIWSKPNPMPESVTDRPTKAHEYVFLFSKCPQYWYDADAIRESFADERNGDPGKYSRTSQLSKGANRNRQDTGFLNNGAGWNRGTEIGGRNRRTVWTVATEPTPFAHFATFPRKLIEPMILAGCPLGGIVLDPFMGSGTTALVARDNGRHYIGSELNPDYVDLALARLRDTDSFQTRTVAPGVTQPSLFEVTR